jgi:hypothetical protein
MFIGGVEDKVGPRVLFDYGYHFPLAVRPKVGTRGGDDGKPGYGKVKFVMNGDRWQGSGGWGDSTFSRQQDVIRMLEGMGGCVEIPFSAMAAAGLMRRSGASAWSSYRDVGESLDWLRVLERRADVWSRECRLCGRECDQGGKHYSEPNEVCVPDEKEGKRLLNVHQVNGARKLSPWMWVESIHILGGCVFEWRDGMKGKKRWFLSGFDQNENDHYFLCELPGKVKGLKDAYEMLKPGKVKAAEEEGVEVRRQGDVFFVERKGVAVAKELRVKNVGLGSLEGPGSDTGSHTVTEAVMDRKQGWRWWVSKGNEFTREEVVENVRVARQRLREKYLHVRIDRVAAPRPHWDQREGVVRERTNAKLTQQAARLCVMEDDGFVKELWERGYAELGLGHGAFTEVAFHRNKTGPVPKPVLVRGCVRHGSGEHKRLDLYDGLAKDQRAKDVRWWEPVKNRALGGWTALGGAGGVD